MNKFNSFIQRGNLIDPPFTNDKFRWSNLRKKLVHLGLIIFFTPHNGRKDLQIMLASFSPRITSDHFPIVLQTANLKWGLIPFRFNNYIINDKSFIFLCGGLTLSKKATRKDEMEIKDALLSFDGNKASGLDDFTMELYKKFWNTFKIKIMEAFQDFFEMR